VTDFVLALPILLFSVVAHEYAHAWTAYREGDDTAYALGRLTLNPLPHIDPMMSIIFPIGLYLMTKGAFTFGAAKPVPIDPRKFRHYRRGDLIVSSAGIVTNLLLGAACTGLFALVGLAGGVLTPLAGAFGTIQRMLVFGVLLNFTLAIFNLVPIPPLDGSHLLYHALPPAWGARFRRLGRFGFVVIFALFLVPGLWDVVLWPVDALTRGALSLVGGYALPAAVR
jgi:Zn-dependent protease